MEPESGSIRPAMMLKIVVLPQPLGPMMLTKSRSLMLKERSSRTRTSPALPAKDFRTFRTLNWTGTCCIARYPRQLVCQLYATGLIVKIHYYHDVMTAAQNPPELMPSLWAALVNPQPDHPSSPAMSCSNST